jgi:hypothetical protein
MTAFRLTARRLVPHRLLVLAGAQLAAAPIAALGGAMAAGFAAVALLAADPAAPRTVSALQFSAVALAGAASMLLRDPAAVITAASPTPLWLRRAVILAVALPATALAWLGLLRLAGVGDERPVTLTLELAAVAAVGLAVGARRPVYRPPAVVAAFIAAAVVWPERVLPAAGDHGPTRLAAAAIALAALAAYAHASRDPVRR